MPKKQSSCGCNLFSGGKTKRKSSKKSKKSKCRPLIGLSLLEDYSALKSRPVRKRASSKKRKNKKVKKKYKSKKM